MKPQLILHQITVKFFQPLIKHRFLTVSASVIIGIALYVGVDIGLAELVRQNSYDMHMLAAELLTESGPKFTDASIEHSKMLSRYTEHLEERQFALLLRVLYPTYSPKKVLASATQTLKDAANEEAARKAIWKAGAQSNQLYMAGKRFSLSPFAWFESEDLPARLLADVNDAFSMSREMVSRLEKEQTRANALATCRANRKTVLLLYLGRLASDQARIRGDTTEFLDIVTRAHKYTTIVADKQKDEKAKQDILEWAESESRRAKISKAMLVNDMDTVCELLKEAIEKAFEKEKAKLAE